MKARLWLLGIVSCVLAGCGNEPPKAVVSAASAPVAPQAVKSESLPAVKFVEVTKESGVKFVHCNGAKGEKLLPETMGSGVAILDYNGDGFPDLFFVNSCDWPGAQRSPQPTHALYQNDGKGRFVDVTRDAGLDKSVYGQGVAVGDYDNDGDPDLYVTALGGGYLYRNDGKGHFEDVTTAANAHASDGWLASAAFIDIENDGDLDLFICQYVDWSPQADRAQSTNLVGTGILAYDAPNTFGGSFCILLRNDGGKFTDVSEAAGVRVRTPDHKVPVAKALGVAPCDVDGDGLVDVAVANDTVQNFLFHNLGNGQFEEIGMRAGVAFDQSGSARGAMGIDWADFKNDDSVGLAIGNFANEMMALYVSDEPPGSKGRLQFADLANTYGLGAPTQPPLKFGLFFLDYDRDGRLDLLSANGHLENDIAKVQRGQTYAQSAQLFWNSGRPGPGMYVLVDATAAGPELFKPMVGRGSAYVDFDCDGDLDLVLTENGGPARLFRNDGGNQNHGLRLELRGGAGSNRDAIGARVVLRAGDVTQTRQLFLAKGYLSSVEHALTFGLGKATRADEVTIKWPSGETTTLKDVAASDKPLVVNEQERRK
jgi:enediyne biosynthesis protein E4